MKRTLLFLACSGLLGAQAAPEATAELGKPARVGAIARVIGSNEELDSGLLREVTLDSASLALTFPNAVDNVVAKADEKLLILRGSLRNLAKKTTITITSSAAIGLRLREEYQGKGRFQFVLHYDPQTLQHLTKSLRPGESGSFVGVWRVPVDFMDFRFGVTTERATIIPYYDLRPAIGKLSGVFATPDGLGANATATVRVGSRFELDGLEMLVSQVTRPVKVGPYATDPNKPVLVVTVQATNRLLKPSRWGWQYFTAELLSAGAPLKAYPEIMDRATERTWSGDLAPGATVEAQFLFYPAGPLQPKAFRLAVLESGRSVEVLF